VVLLSQLHLKLIPVKDQAWYGDSTLVSSLCGKQVEIINTDNQKSVTVTIADDCPTCDNANSIDLSVQAFDTLSDQYIGKIPIKWRFV
jgi:expansin (peptidoglycan-binding protein)